MALPVKLGVRPANVETFHKHQPEAELREDDEASYLPLRRQAWTVNNFLTFEENSLNGQALGAPPGFLHDGTGSLLAR